MGYPNFPYTYKNDFLGEKFYWKCVPGLDTHRCREGEVKISPQLITHIFRGESRGSPTGTMWIDEGYGKTFHLPFISTTLPRKPWTPSKGEALALVHLSHTHASKQTSKRARSSRHG